MWFFLQSYFVTENVDAACGDYFVTENVDAACGDYLIIPKKNTNSQNLKKVNFFHCCWSNSRVIIMKEKYT